MMDCEIGGKIEDFPLGDIMQIVRLSGRTGRLSIRGPINGRIEFRNGKIERATISAPYEDIGTILMDHGSITERQLREAVRRQKESARGELLGQVLVSLGHATVEELRRAMRDQVDQVVNDLLLLRDGRFEFQVTADTSDVVTQDVSEILMEANVRQRRKAG